MARLERRRRPKQFPYHNMAKGHMASQRKTKHGTRKNTHRQIKRRPTQEALVVNTKPARDPRYYVPINSAGQTWGVNREFPPPDWDHWKVFGMKPTMDREKVIEHFHTLKPSWETGVAYGRILSELWSKGVKPRGAND